MSRLIVKGLPTNCTEQSLRKHFAKYGQITDCTLKYTKEGKFRKFAFLGFSEDQSAGKAIDATNNSFIQSSKIQVEKCLPFGHENKPRAWSRFSKDSSAYKRVHGDDEVTAQENGGKRKKIVEGSGDFTIGIFDQVAPTQKKGAKKATEAEDPLLKELLEGIEGDTRLSLIFLGLPASIKQKNIKEWLAPVRVKAMKIAQNDDNGGAFVSFNRPPDVRRALQMSGTFLGGFKVTVRRVKESDEENEESAEKQAEDAGVDEEASKKEEERTRDEILETGRLFVRNLPFVTTEDDLTGLFKRYGEVSEVQLIVDKKTGKCKGFGIVEFIFPENAMAAYSELDGTIFKGRMLHIISGQEKRIPKEEAEDKEGGASYKTEKQKKLKDGSTKATHSWNALFLGPNAIADTLAEKLGKEKRDLALAETRLVQQTREFLLENGVKLDAFSRPSSKRSTKVMLVKNLPIGVEAEELERMFSSKGDCQKILLPESSVTAIVVMGNSVDAKKAFKALAYSRFRTKPLFLEWAPGDVFGEKTIEEKTEEEAAEEPTTSKKETRKRGDELTEEDKKNRKSKKLKKQEEEKAKEEIIEFSESGKAQDESEPETDPVETAEISKKLDAKDPLNKLSMGFGFIQFYTNAEAEKAVKELQGAMLNGHSLELKISHREVQTEQSTKKRDSEKAKQGKCTKILVRNIPFQASIKEVEELFKSFGEVKTIRVPKKVGSRDEHRGFGFVDFMSIGDAKRAFESLVHSTHLYGRRLVLEWAKADDTVEELRSKTSSKFSGNVAAKKRVKKRIDDLQADIFKAGDVGDEEG
ncbi:unnamed protein product, partial [Mesorhabditis spiculigera]